MHTLLGTRRGFSLLEILVVVVILGILAGLALTRFGSVQEKAYLATMQNDLRNFATARAIYVTENNATPVRVSDVTGFSFSDGVYNTGYQTQSLTQWGLVVSHRKTSATCALWAMDESKTHRIECSETEDLGFATTAGDDPNTVTFDATPAIQTLAFGAPQPLGAAHAARPEDIALVSWNFGDGTTTAGPPETHTVVRHTYADLQSYTATVTLVKKDGKLGRGTRTVAVATPANQAPTAEFTVTPVTAPAHETLSFDARASLDPEGHPLAYVWDFGDGSRSSGATAAHTYTKPGDYAVRLTVSDGEIPVLVARTITITNRAPQAAFTISPETSVAGTEVTFDASTSLDLDGPLARYDWLFSDGVKGEGSLVRRPFAAAGSYTVRLTVTDEQGATDEETRSLTVTDPSHWTAWEGGAEVNGWNFKMLGDQWSNGVRIESARTPATGTGTTTCLWKATKPVTLTFSWTAHTLEYAGVLFTATLQGGSANQGREVSLHLRECTGHDPHWEGWIRPDGVNVPLVGEWVEAQTASVVLP